MPPKKSPRTARKKQWKRKPRSKGGYRTWVNRSLNPIPQRSIVKHKYATSVNTVAGSGLYYINLNSMYDPDRSGIGHQPYGRDTFASLYNQYRVIGCKYTVEVSSNSATILVGTYVGNEPFTYVAVGGDFNELKENPRARFITQCPGGQIKKIHGYANCASILGRTRAQYMADEQTAAQVNNNPSENCVLTIATATTAGVPQTGASVMLMLEYICEWFDPTSLVPS